MAVSGRKGHPGTRRTTPCPSSRQSPDLHDEFVAAVIGTMNSSEDFSAQILNSPELKQKLLSELVPVNLRGAWRRDHDLEDECFKQLLSTFLTVCCPNRLTGHRHFAAAGQAHLCRVRSPPAASSILLCCWAGFVRAPFRQAPRDHHRLATPRREAHIVRAAANQLVGAKPTAAGAGAQRAIASRCSQLIFSLWWVSFAAIHVLLTSVPLSS